MWVLCFIQGGCLTSEYELSPKWTDRRTDSSTKQHTRTRKVGAVKILHVTNRGLGRTGRVGACLQRQIKEWQHYLQLYFFK